MTTGVLPLPLPFVSMETGRPFLTLVSMTTGLLSLPLFFVSMTTGLCVGPTEHAQFISQCTQQGWCQGAHFPITGAVHSCFRLQSYSNQCMLYLKSPILVNPALWCYTLIFHASTTLYSTQREKGSGHMTTMLLTWQNVTNLSHYTLLLISTSLIGIINFSDRTWERGYQLPYSGKFSLVQIFAWIGNLS